MRFLADERLYAETDRCLEYLRGSAGSQPVGARLRERCHMFWHGPFGAKQLFAVKSFLATQDADHLGLTLWLETLDELDEDRSGAYLRPLLPFVDVVRFDPGEEARGTPLEGRLDLYQGHGPTASSNFARLVVLHNHGGIYVDVDTMFLRDLHELPNALLGDEEFCSQWSNHIRSGNNAVLRLRKGGTTVRRLMERAIAEASCRARAILAYEGGEEIDILVLPSTFFDPLWAHRDLTDRSTLAPFDRFEDFFNPVRRTFRRSRRDMSFRDFFRGAFAYHWHNCWAADEHPDSYFGAFDRELDRVLATRGIVLDGGPPGDTRQNGGSRRANVAST